MLLFNLRKTIGSAKGFVDSCPDVMIVVPEPNNRP